MSARVVAVIPRRSPRVCLFQRLVSDGGRARRDPVVFAGPARHHPARRLPCVPPAVPRLVRQGRFAIRGRHGFSRPSSARARRRQDEEGSWIDDEILESYCALHERGLAHSVETWQDGALVGGLYGVALGGAFFGESMFHRATDASKVALVALVDRLRDARIRPARYAVGDGASGAVRRRGDSAPSLSSTSRCGVEGRAGCRFPEPCCVMPSESPTPRVLFGVALISGSLLMTELSLTRIFSVTMYYHFAFMAISIALFGLSASGVYVFLLRDRLAARSTDAAADRPCARVRRADADRAGGARPRARRLSTPRRRTSR